MGSTRRRQLIVASVGVARAPGALAATESESDELVQGRKAVVDAFNTGDRAVIHRWISDAYSGMRFFQEWKRSEWQEVGRRVAGAKFVSRRGDTATYDVQLPQTDGTVYSRPLFLYLRDGRWIVDFNSLLGPFPTFVPDSK